jgi:hypothetical protein
MTTWIAAARPYLEALYFLAGIFLLLVAGYGLKQVRLLKLDIRLRNERAAKEKAIEAAQAYLSQYVPLSNAWSRDQDAQKLPDFRGPIGDFTRESLVSAPAIRDYAARFERATWLPAINALDGIAAAFVTGVADEVVGFEIIGRTFCATVEQNYDVISLGRAHGAHNYFESTVKLYRVWSSRLSRAEIEETKRQLDAKAHALPDVRIPAIGHPQHGV